VVPVLAGFDVDVSNAVAPFDHESNVDSLLLEFGVARVRNQQVFDCIAAAGFVPPTTTALPDRDDPMLRSAAFPDVETLAREGFPNLPGTPGTLGPEDTRSEAEAAASRACAEQVDGSQTDVIEAIGLFGSMRSAWEEVLAEIDALDATHSLVDEFGACLREEGIPAEFTTSEGRYLGYVDSLLATGSDQSTWPEIRQRMGRLYADCGQDLFAARSALRSGERRESFLSQHQDSISRLSALLLGLDQPPDTPTGATSTTIAAVGDAELLACMVGGWQFDTAAFEVELQNHEDPSGIYLLIDYVSGGGSLVVRADGTFTLGYDDLTYLIEAPTSGGTRNGITGRFIPGSRRASNASSAGAAPTRASPAAHRKRAVLLVENEQGSGYQSADRQDLVRPVEGEDLEQDQGPEHQDHRQSLLPVPWFPQLELHETSHRCLVEHSEDAESTEQDPNDEEHRSQKHLAPVHVHGPGDDAHHTDGNADRHGGCCENCRHSCPPLVCK
jgi:hypothetical protein